MRLLPKRDHYLPMNLNDIDLHPDIAHAHTLPNFVYTSPEVFALSRSRVFEPSWQFLADDSVVRVPGQVCPVTLMPGFLDEPLLLTRDDSDQLHCLSNVCTHRGSIVCEFPSHERSLRCRYHGRRFGLDGTFQSMPEFDEVVGFPSAEDSLPRVPLGKLGPFLFASMRPDRPIEEVFGPMMARIGWIDLAALRLDPARSREHTVKCNWALYIENYLDGLHIPFVHHELASALDYSEYKTEGLPHGVLQLGVAANGDDCFDIPDGAQDHGRRISAYYYWFFPNLMFNFYPWGLSINVVQPVGPEVTKVSFLRYVLNDDIAGGSVSSDAAVDRVEREDEAIVELVQRGMHSNYYKRGRYSPNREEGTHHFHLMLAAALKRGRDNTTAASEGGPH